MQLVNLIFKIKFVFFKVKEPFFNSNYMEEQNIYPLPVTRKRPEFLTVLCIISFVGIGSAIFGALISFLLNTSGNSMLFLHQNNSIFGNIIDNPDDYIKMQQINGIIALISALVCLAGVIMMWKLKKTGYFIYIIGEIVPPIAAVSLSRQSGFGEMFATFYSLGLVIGFIFPIAFIIMYGMNLKHMS